MAKAKKPKKGFLDGYETYDPEVEGYGSRDAWLNTFYERVGVNKAQEIIGEETPYDILGVGANKTWQEILATYRKLAMKWHPDKNPEDAAAAKEMMKKINAALEIIESMKGE